MLLVFFLLGINFSHAALAAQTTQSAQGTLIAQTTQAKQTTQSASITSVAPSAPLSTTPSASPSTTPSTSLSISATQLTLKKQQKSWSLGADLSVESNFKDQLTSEAKEARSLYLTPSIRILKQASLSAKLGIEQSTTTSQDKVTLADTLVALARDPIQLGKSIDLLTTLSAVLPTDVDNRKGTSFQGAVGTSAGIVKTYSLFGQAGDMGGYVSVAKNIHEFDRDTSREENLSHRQRTTIELNQNLTGKIALNLSGRYQIGWTYSGVLRTAFLFSQKLSYHVSPNAEVYIGHTNEGDALQANGVDSNIKVYDPSQSVFVAGVAMSL